MGPTITAISSTGLAHCESSTLMSKYVVFDGTVMVYSWFSFQSTGLAGHVVFAKKEKVDNINKNIAYIRASMHVVLDTR